MAITPHFFHNTLRKYIITFGTLFNGITVERGNTPTIEVPILYGSKQKWFAKLQANPELDRAQAVTMPMMSFIITNLMYDTERKTSSLGKMYRANESDPSQARRVYHPVPYNIDIALTIYTKNMADYLQIFEQIVPFFKPDFVVTIEDIAGIDTIQDVPIVMNDIALIHDSEGGMDEYRVINSDINFTVKGMFYGPIQSQPIIKKVVVDTRIGYLKMDDPESQVDTRYTVVPDPETALATDDYGFTETLEVLPEGPPIPEP